MITAARPTSGDKSHWYFQDGTPCFNVPNKSKGGERPATLRDAKSLNLLPSPTSITKILHREALVNWQIEQAVLATQTSPRRENEALDDFIERVLHIDREQDQERDAAALRGRAIHLALQQAIVGAWYDEQWVDYVKPAVELLLNPIGRPVATEKIIVNLNDGYAGMTDLILENDREVWVIDHKSCKRIPDKPYNENRLQLAAYAGGLGNTGEKVIRCANLYISTTEPGKLYFSEVEDWRNDFSRFKLLVQYWRLTNNFPFVV